MIRAARILEQAQLRLAMLALAVMMLTTVMDVVLRYVFGNPIHGAYDVVETCLAVFVFNGMSAVFFRRKNVVIDVIDHVVPECVARLLARLGEAVTVAVLAVMLWAMIYPALQAYAYGDRKLELGLPVWVIWLFVLFGAAGSLACMLAALLRPSTLDHGAEP